MTGATFSHLPSSFLSRVWHKPSLAVRAWSMRVFMRMAERRERAALRPLLEWDSRSLADIGLSRQQVAWALGRPLSERATALLAHASGRLSQ